MRTMRSMASRRCFIPALMVAALCVLGASCVPDETWQAEDSPQQPAAEDGPTTAAWPSEKADKAALPQAGVVKVPGPFCGASNPFTFQLQMPIDEYAGSLFVHDVNRDRARDFVVTTPGHIGVYDHCGSELWQAADDILLDLSNNHGDGLPGTQAPGAIAADMDGDGQQEIAYLTEWGDLRIRNAETGALESSYFTFGAGGLAIANFRGLGDRDAVLQYGTTQSGISNLRAIRLEDGGQLWYRAGWQTPMHSQLRVADVNGDGRDEVVGPTFLDHNGNAMGTSTYMGHVDSLAIGDIVTGGPVEIAMAEQDYPHETVVSNYLGELWRTAWTGLPYDGKCANERDPDKVAVGDFAPKRPGLEVFARSSCGNYPWVMTSGGDVFAHWNVTDKAPFGWCTMPTCGNGDEGGIDVVIPVDWTGGPKQHIFVRENTVCDDVAVVDAVTGDFVEHFDTAAVRTYAANIAGDFRDELVVMEAAGNVGPRQCNGTASTIKVFWNPQLTSGSKPNPWTNQTYRRVKQNWNYYSP